MDHQLIIHSPAISPSDFQEVESAIRHAGVLTCFDSSVDSARAILFVSEKFRFGTETRALIDLNIFRDILSLGRTDRGRNAGHQRLAAAVILFFQAAEILVEPCMALHESPSNAAKELELFRKVDNADPLELLEVFHGKRTSVTLPDLHDKVSLDHLELQRPLHHTALLEIALLKLATILREDLCNFERLERFLNWSFEEFLFIQEPVILAIHQLAGNRAKPLLKGFNKLDPSGRLEGVRNALWDCLLIREWVNRVKMQKTENKIWLLCSRDETLRDYARKLIFTGQNTADADEFIEKMIEGVWPKHQAKRISMLYHRLILMSGASSRVFNRSVGSLDVDLMKTQLSSQLAEKVGMAVQ